MTGGRLGVLIAITVVLAGCGAGDGPRSPDLHRLPLVPGARVVSQVRQCDRGASAYCGVELVVVDQRYATSAALVTAEHDQLIRSKWSGAAGDNGDEHAADSPGHRLRVTYATAYFDLKGIDLEFIKRSRATALALSRALFDRRSAMSILLEVGPY